MTKQPVQILGAIVAAVSACLLVGSASASAQALPVAPPVSSTQDTVTFIVQDPGDYKRTTASVSALANFGSWPGVGVTDFDSWVLCDDHKFYDVAITMVHGHGAYADYVAFDADIPLVLIGHSCELGASARTLQHFWFEAPKVERSDGKTRTRILGTLLYESHNGGL